MVRQCYVCKKLDYLNINLTYHRIPQDAVIRRTWFSIVGLPPDAEKTAPKRACMCSDHFLEEDFEYRGASKRKYLKKGAVPFQRTEESPTSSQGGVRFPTDRLERLKWFKVLGMEPVFTRNVYLCSDHFEPSSFRVQPMGRRVLKKNSLPRKLPSAVSASESESETESETESVTESNSDTETASETESLVASSKEEPSDAAEIIVLKVEPEPETTLIPVSFPEESCLSSATVSATESMIDYKGEQINERDPLTESLEIDTEKEQINDPFEEGQDQQVFVKREKLSPVPAAAVSSTTEPETKPSILTVEHEQEGIQINTQTPDPIKLLTNTQCSTNESYVLKKTQGELEVAKTTIQFKNKKIRTLQQQNRRLRARVSSLQSLLRYLEANKLINDNPVLTENGQTHESCAKIVSRFLKEP